MQPIYQVWIVFRAVQSPFKLTCLDSNVDSLILRCALLRSRLFPSRHSFQTLQPYIATSAELLNDGVMVMCSITIHLV